MKLSKLSQLVLVVSLSSGVALAQGGGAGWGPAAQPGAAQLGSKHAAHQDGGKRKKGGSKKKGGEKGGERGEGKPAPPAKRAAAAAPLVRAKDSVSLVLPVAGLSEDSAQAVEAELLALTSNTFQCPACKAEFAGAGECGKCARALERSADRLVKSAKAATAEHQLSLQSNEGMTLRLSDLERLLAAHSAQFEPSELKLPGKCTLVVKGVSQAEQAAAIEKALSPKLFEKANAKAADGRLEIRVVAGTDAPSRAIVQAAIATAGPGFTLADVVWNQPR